MVKPFYQPRPEQVDPETETDNQDRDVERPEEMSDLPDLPRRNPDRGKQLPGRFRQNIADVTVYSGDRIEWKSKKHRNTLKTQEKQNKVKSLIPRRKEIDGLLEKGAFEFVNESEILKGMRIFGSQFVDEVKNSVTAKAFEKSRLVIQAYNDQGKAAILT